MSTCEQITRVCTRSEHGLCLTIFNLVYTHEALSTLSSSSPPSLGTSFHLPLSPLQSYAVVANVICVSLCFSCSVKLWNPLKEIEYRMNFLGFSLLEVVLGYIQLRAILQVWQKQSGTIDAV